MTELKEKLLKLEEYIGRSLTYRHICDICGIEYSNGNTKAKQLKVLESLFLVEKRGTRYFIKKRREHPTKIIDGRSKGSGTGRFKEYPQFKIPEGHFHGKGIYSIILNNEIYIGSTKDFRYRFISYMKDGIESVGRDMLLRGATFELIEEVDKDLDKDSLERLEDKYIQIYQNNPDWIVANKKGAFRLDSRINNRKQSKKKNFTNIVVNQDDYDLIIRLLEENNIAYYESIKDALVS